VTDELPNAVRTFVAANIRSVSELEALLLLRSARSKVWRSEEVAMRLFIPLSRARQVLSSLTEAGLIEATADAGCRYAALPALREVIDQTAETYAHQLVPLTEFIHDLRTRDRISR
jgi:hypothetical protein